MYTDVLAAVEQAGQAILEVYGSDFDVRWKGYENPVTEADLAAQTVILAKLEAYGHPILSEEKADDELRLESDTFWLVDPLDGTSDFVKKNGEFCIMVALIEKGVPVFGAIHIPIEGKTYYAEKGKGAFVQESGADTRIFVSSTDSLGNARAVVTRGHFTEELEQMFDAIEPKEKTPTGSNGIKAARVAEGKADFFLNPTNKMGEWDVAAPHILIEEAGGKVTNVRGKPLTYNKKHPNAESGILATNGILHEQLVSKIT